MPNYITNRITLEGPENDIKNIIERFSTVHPDKKQYAYDGSEIFKDENGIPGWYKDGVFKDCKQNVYNHIPHGYLPDIKKSFIQFPDFAKIIPPPDCPEYRDEPNQDAVRNSPNWWYTWNVNNWGVKWNSHECEQVSENVYEFKTAWSGVANLIWNMARKFPSVEFFYEYADEDTGHNIGQYIFKGNKATTYYIEEGSKEAYELAFNLMPWKKEYWRLTADGSTYEFFDEE